MRQMKETAAGLGCAALLVIIGCAIYGANERLDSLGWISHQEKTLITAGGDWLVGEDKDCWSAPVNYYAALAKKYGGLTVDKSGKAIDDRMVDYVMSSINCDDGPQHRMKVKFYGRRFQTDYKVVTWRCTREQTSFLNGTAFTCYQTGGHR
jgi:hypothetical protein